MNIHPKCYATVEQNYDKENGWHVWRWVCECGAKGEWCISPKHAEREGEKHDGLVIK